MVVQFMLTDYLDFNHYTLTISFTDTVRLLSQSLSQFLPLLSFRSRSFLEEGVLREDVFRDGGPDGEPGGLDILGFDHNKSTPKCLKPAVPSVDGEKLDFKST